MSFPPLHFVNDYQPIVFFFLLFSSSSSFRHLFIFSLTLQLPPLPTKTYKSLSHFFIPVRIKNLLSSQTPSSSLMAPKAKKACYVITSGVFNLTHWIGNIRLDEPPPLLYRPKDHLLENVWLGLASFSNFSHFQVLL